MANNLADATNTSYHRLIDAMYAAEACSSRGNVFETSQTVKRIFTALYDLGQYFNQWKESFRLNEFIAKVQKYNIDGFNEKLAKVWYYIHAPETFIAEAYLVSAEKALVNNEMFCVANAYTQIKPGEKLRELLDAESFPANNLKERAEMLDKLVSILQNPLAYPSP